MQVRERRSAPGLTEPRGPGETLWESGHSTTSRPNDVCNDLSAFEPDLGDEWKNWRMVAPRWDSDGEPKESAVKKIEDHHQF